MFLEDELLIIARKVNLTDEENIKSICLELSEKMFQNLFESVGDCSNDSTIIIANAKRINNTYNKVIEILNKENIIFLIPDGFKLLLENKGIKWI